MMIYPQADFARSTPEAQGISSRAIERMLLDIRETGADIHSMLIMRRGHLVFEQYFAPYTAETKHSMFSCSKTFTSMLIGIAQDKGLISVHDHVLDFFPDVEIACVNDNLRAMTIENLLEMGSGHAQDTFGAMLQTENDKNADWVKIFLNRPVDEEPGTRFVYNTGATYMLSAILTRVTGKSALELANAWIFDTIGIKDAEWAACPRGINQGGTGLRITPRDMLRMGTLLLGRGRWGNRQLISNAYICAAQQKHIDNANPDDPNQDPNWAAGYGYQVWRNAFGGFRADGMGGQFIVVLPEREMVVVFTSALGGDLSIGYPLNLIEKYLLPATFDLPQLYGEEAAQSLKKTSEALSHPAFLPIADEAQGFPFGVKFALPENPLRLEKISVYERYLTLTVAGESGFVPYAWGEPALSPDPQLAPAGWTRYARTAATAQWRDDALEIRVNYIGEPLTVYIRFERQGGEMTVSVKGTLGGNAGAAAALK